MEVRPFGVLVVDSHPPLSYLSLTVQLGFVSRFPRIKATRAVDPQFDNSSTDRKEYTHANAIKVSPCLDGEEQRAKS